jgi:hypothetical protein
MLPLPNTLSSDDPNANAHQHNAMGYVSEAFAEALLDGIDGSDFAYAAMYIALREMVGAFGEETVAQFTQDLPERIRSGQFSLLRKN